MKMTAQQKAEYQAYRKECKMSNVEPSRADFLAGDIPECVTYQLECVTYQLVLQKPQAFAATA